MTLEPSERDLETNTTSVASSSPRKRSKLRYSGSEVLSTSEEVVREDLTQRGSLTQATSPVAGEASGRQLGTRLPGAAPGALLTEDQPDIERLVATFSPNSSERDEDSNDEGSVTSGNTATSSPIFESFFSREVLAEQKREQAREIRKLRAQLDRRDTELLIKDNQLLMAKEEQRKVSAKYANLSQFRETGGSWTRTGPATPGSSSGQGSFVFQLKTADLPQLKSLHASSLDTYVRQVRTIVSSIPPAERTMELGRVIENRTNFHPDLQAEIDLIVQSSGKDPMIGFSWRLSLWMLW